MTTFILACFISILQSAGPGLQAKPLPIIYFSFDNGITWKNGSAGLPPEFQVGLGAIAVDKTRMGVSLKRYGIYLFNAKGQVWEKIPTDKRITDANPAALFFHNDVIYAGTQHAGVFRSKDKGKSWQNINKGLGSKTIRRFAAHDNRLYAGTNSGLYSLDERSGQWVLEYDNNSVQVNGVAFSNGYIYIATNKGVFRGSKEGQWAAVLEKETLHNISADGNTIYAMTYSQLLSSKDNGVSWTNIQKGLPPQLYTFNVVASRGQVFAGQWDGLYRKNEGRDWTQIGTGLPPKFALTNLAVYNGMMVVSGSGQ